MKNWKTTVNPTGKTPNSDTKELAKKLNIILSRNEILKKEIIIAGDFNMNLLDFEQNKKSPR